MNPFSTSHWTPGAIPFLADNGTDLFDWNRLVGQMTRLGPIQQIVGPHGSGKSTFLASLTKQLEKRNMNVRSVMLTSECRRLSDDFRPSKSRSSGDGSTFFLDGYEQLSMTRRFLLRQRGWHEKARLIVTCHRPAWRVPILYETKPLWTVFLRIVQELTRETTSMDETELQRIFLASGRNFRTALLSLYDYWE